MKKIILSLTVFISTAGFSQTLDNTFNPAGELPGLVRTPNMGATDVAVGPDHKIYTCSEYYTEISGDFAWHFAVSKYNTDGTLDNTFGNGGTTITDFTNGGSDRSFPKKIHLQSDGKIIVTGMKYVPGDLTATLIMARYDNTGILDPSFGNAGIAITPTMSSIYATNSASVLQSDGKIVLVGTNDNGVTDDLYVTRYNSDGTVDNTFGENGAFQFDLMGGIDCGRDVQLTADNKIVIVGVTLPFGDIDPWRTFVVQLNTDGTMDTSFGSLGVTLVNLEGSTGNVISSSIGIQSTNKMVVFGTTYTNESIYTKQFTVRLNADGSEDNTYGTNGVSLVNYESELFDMVYSGKVMVLPDDAMYLVGGTDSISCSTCTHNQNLSIVRVSSDGDIDNVWGYNGKFNMNIDFEQISPILIPTREKFLSATMQPDGKLLCVGESQNSSESILMRLDTTSTNTNATVDVLDPLNSFSVYPNPSSDWLQIACEKILNEKTYYNITNTIGQIIITNEIHTLENLVDISNIEKGAYFLELQTSDNTVIYSQKIIVNK